MLQVFILIRLKQKFNFCIELNSNMNQSSQNIFRDNYHWFKYHIKYITKTRIRNNRKLLGTPNVLTLKL